MPASATAATVSSSALCRGPNSPRAPGGSFAQCRRHQRWEFAKPWILGTSPRMTPDANGGPTASRGEECGPRNRGPRGISARRAIHLGLKRNGVPPPASRPQSRVAGLQFYRAWKRRSSPDQGMTPAPGSGSGSSLRSCAVRRRKCHPRLQAEDPTLSLPLGSKIRAQPRTPGAGNSLNHGSSGRARGCHALPLPSRVTLQACPRHQSHRRGSAGGSRAALRINTRCRRRAWAWLSREPSPSRGLPPPWPGPPRLR